MKVSPLTGAPQFLNVVREKRDGEGGTGGEAYQKQQQSKKDGDGEPATYEQVEEAIQAFAGDTQAQASGLSASVEGKGPGLKVILKDVNGSVIRQFSGEEFLKIREGVGKDVQTRGKILDQKL